MTLSKERLEQFIRQPLENGLTRGEIMQLAKMMLNQDDWNAAQQNVIDDLRVQLERRERDKQEPVAYLFTGSDVELPHLSFPEELDAGQKENCQALYAAPPAPVVPDEMKRITNEGELIGYEYHGERYGVTVGATWNACRAAMLGSTISNSADFAIEEEPQSFGNSEQLNSSANEKEE